MISKKQTQSVLFFLIMCFLLSPEQSPAQGPLPSYYYDPATRMPWAECFFYFSNGSQQGLPFLPVTNKTLRAPMGILNYLRDVNLRGPLVFIGNGIVSETRGNSYQGRKLDYTNGEINVAGKIVMLCYDFPDPGQKEPGPDPSLKQVLEQAAQRKARAAVLFSSQKNPPFLKLDPEKGSLLEKLPVITVTRESAARILAGSAINLDNLFKEWQEKGQTTSLELIVELRLRIQGNFSNASSENFSIFCQPGKISANNMEKLIELNEDSLKFLQECFSGLNWKKLSTVYFANYDSKVFYTHHWGKGLADQAGVYQVYANSIPPYGLIVHENCHIITDLNWGPSSSFMDEGIAMYAEALATDRDKNHNRSRDLLTEEKLFSVQEMTGFNIGIPGVKTDVAYPASGSFIGFLLAKYDLESVKKIYIQEGSSSEKNNKDKSWTKIFGRSLAELEKEWHSWLKNEEYKNKSPF